MLGAARLSDGSTRRRSSVAAGARLLILLLPSGAAVQEPFNVQRKLPAPPPPKSAVPDGRGTPLPRRVVLGFHGDYFRQPTQDETVRDISPFKCSDFFVSEHNIKDLLIGALKQQGIEVAVYLHTVRAAGCPNKDQALLNALQPVQYEFEEANLPLIMDSYMKVMSLIAKKESPSDSTAIILLRFDVQYRVPLLSWNIRWEAMNFAFRDVGFQWERCHKVSDLLHIFPRKMLPGVLDAFEETRRKGPSVDCINPKGSAHLVYDSLVQRLGEANMNFISPALRSSTVAPLAEQKDNFFLGIERACRNPHDRCSIGVALFELPTK